jgi:hypothetical protein
MRTVVLTISTALLAAIGLIALQACFYERTPYYPPPATGGYAYGPSYGYGDYDEQHQWHDQSWWVNNRRDWAEQHHPEWVRSQEGTYQGHTSQEGTYQGQRTSQEHHAEQQQSRPENPKKEHPQGDHDHDHDHDQNQ